MARILNLSAILEEYNPQSLRTFLDKYPLKRDVLGGKELLGDVLPAAEPSYQAEMELVVASLAEVQQRIHPNFERLKNRYRKMKNLKSFVALISAFTSAGLLAAFVGNAGTLVILITAILNFVSSLFLVVAGNLDAPSIDGKRNLAEVFEKLNAIYSESEKVQYKLQKLLKAGGTRGADVLQLIEQAETLAFDLRRIEREIVSK